VGGERQGSEGLEHGNLRRHDGPCEEGCADLQDLAYLAKGTALPLRRSRRRRDKPRRQWRLMTSVAPISWVQIGHAPGAPTNRAAMRLYEAASPHKGAGVQPSLRGRPPYAKVEDVQTTRMMVGTCRVQQARAIRTRSRGPAYPSLQRLQMSRRTEKGDLGNGPTHLFAKFRQRHNADVSA
jgi:hypothetical protein